MKVSCSIRNGTVYTENVLTAALQYAIDFRFI
jgi:hypothetical protein